MTRLKTRGPENGVCNICGLPARLTEDHIPPKSVPRVGKALLQRLTDTLGVEKSEKSTRLFQGGVKYRSICSKCNNELLGARYDPTLIDFCKRLHSTLGKQVHLPVTLPVKVNRLVRALVGHIISHRISNHRTGELYASLTDYFMDDSLAFPKNLRAYCWTYPYKAQVVAHGLGSIFDYRKTGETFVFSLIKFYPVGFLCSIEDLPEREVRQVTQLDHLTTADVDEPTSPRFQ